MAATYNLYFSHWNGSRFMEVPFGPDARFEYIKAVNRPGQFTLELPYEVGPGVLQLDYLIQFWRSPSYLATNYLDFLGWLRYWKVERRSDGSVWTILKGHDANGLLNRRIVAYDSDNAWTTCDTDPHTIIGNLWAQNFTSVGTNAYRDLAKVNGLPSPVGANISMSSVSIPFSPTHVQMNFAWWPVAEVMQKVHEISFANDTTADKSQTVYYGLRVKGIESSGYGKPILEFAIRYGQWGRDATWEPDNPGTVIFNNASGNLVNEFYEEDHRVEQNVIYAGGKDVGSSRTVNQLVDQNRTRQSGWARSEGWADARGQDTSTQISHAGYAKLTEMGPRIIAGGDLVSTPNTAYAYHWFHGDRVTIEVFGKKYDGLIMATQLALENGEEKITARVLHQEL